MKARVTIVFILIAGIFLFFVFKGGYIKPQSNTPAPSAVQASTQQYLEKIAGYDLRNYHGNKVVLDKAEFQGSNKIIVHLWASWCGPCVNEVPEVIEYAKKNPEVKFLVISMDDYQEDIEKFLKSFPEFDSNRFLRVWDRDHLFSKLFDADRLPMTIVMAPSKSEPVFIKSVADWKRMTF